MRPAIKFAATGTVAYLGLGTNQGDRLDHLRRAVYALAVHPEIRVEAASGVFESQFVGEGEQESYLNACLRVRTELDPTVLLAVLKGTEGRHGRRPGGHLLPRPLDLDILLFGDRISDDPGLTLPHPRLRERAFVLEPLVQIAPESKFPDSCETVAEACAKIRRKDGPWVRLREDLHLVPDLLQRNKEDWRAALAVHCR